MAPGRSKESGFPVYRAQLGERTMAAMPDFALELYVPAADVDAEAHRLAELARELAADGTAIRYRRSFYLPGEETCFFVFAADSGAAVERLARRGELAGARVVEITSNERSAR